LTIKNQELKVIKTILTFAGFAVLTAVTMDSAIFWDVMPLPTFLQNGGIT
jgi:hypothetical protein